MDVEFIKRLEDPGVTSLYECPVCFTAFGSEEGRGKPWITPCGHTVCHDCGTKVIMQSKAMSRGVRTWPCVTCQKQHKIHHLSVLNNEKDVQDKVMGKTPINYAVQDVAEFLAPLCERVDQARDAISEAGLSPGDLATIADEIGIPGARSLADYRAAIQTLKRELGRVRGKLLEVNPDADSDDSADAVPPQRVQQLQAEIQKRDLELDSVRADEQGLRAERATLVLQLAELTDERDRASAEARGAREDAEGRAREVGELRAALERLRLERGAEAERDVAALRAENARLKEEARLAKREQKLAEQELEYSRKVQKMQQDKMQDHKAGEEKARTEQARWRDKCSEATGLLQRAAERKELVGAALEEFRQLAKGGAGAVRMGGGGVVARRTGPSILSKITKGPGGGGVGGGGATGADMQKLTREIDDLKARYDKKMAELGEEKGRMREAISRLEQENKRMHEELEASRSFKYALGVEQGKVQDLTRRLEVSDQAYVTTQKELHVTLGRLGQREDDIANFKKDARDAQDALVEARTNAASEKHALEAQLAELRAKCVDLGREAERQEQLREAAETKADVAGQRMRELTKEMRRLQRQQRGDAGTPQQSPARPPAPRAEERERQLLAARLEVAERRARDLEEENARVARNVEEVFGAQLVGVQQLWASKAARAMRDPTQAHDMASAEKQAQRLFTWAEQTAAPRGRKTVVLEAYRDTKHCMSKLSEQTRKFARFAIMVERTLSQCAHAVPALFPDQHHAWLARSHDGDDDEQPPAPKRPRTETSPAADAGHAPAGPPRSVSQASSGDGARGRVVEVVGDSPQSRSGDAEDSVAAREVSGSVDSAAPRHGRNGGWSQEGAEAGPSREARRHPVECYLPPRAPPPYRERDLSAREPPAPWAEDSPRREGSPGGFWGDGDDSQRGGEYPGGAGGSAGHPWSTRPASEGPRQSTTPGRAEKRRRAWAERKSQQ
ncbi:unnamed protein product [Pedinophyceae sp. YPF-701]|nr:unnamed protein product [Pedinophyceae sp. YPF-701]